MQDDPSTKPESLAQKGMRSKRKARIRITIAAFAAIFFAGALRIHSWPSIPIAIAGIIGGGLVLKIELENRHLPRRQAWAWAGLLWVCALVVWLLVIWPPDVPPKPTSHFTFSVSTTGNPADTVRLTNHFLIDTNFGVAHRVVGYLLIPANPGQTNVTLYFTVVNSSTVFAEEVDVLAALSPEWQCKPSYGWLPTDAEGFELPKSSSSGLPPLATQSWTFPPFKVASSNWYRLPPLSLTTKPEPKGKVVCLTARAKDMLRASGVAFQLITPIPPHLGLLTNLHKPFAVMGVTNSNGEVIFNISPKDLAEALK